MKRGWEASAQADGRTVAQMRDTEIVQQRIQLFPDLFLIQVAQLEHRLDVFGHRQLAEYRRFLWQVAQTEPCAAMDRHVREVAFIQIQISAVRRHQAHHHVEAGSLAGAVRAEQTDDFAAGHLERDVLHHGTCLVALLELLGAQFAHYVEAFTVEGEGGD
jgi:hypothetical protein